MELRGASLSWAPKDKSSRKNVLEVSGGGWEKERGLTDGLRPLVGKPQEGGPGESGTGILRAQNQSCVHLGDPSTVFLASQILQFPFTSPWPWSVVRSRGSLGDETYAWKNSPHPRQETPCPLLLTLTGWKPALAGQSPGSN